MPHKRKTISQYKKPHVYYDEDNKFVLKRRTGKVYDYVEITGFFKSNIPIDDYDKEGDDWMDVQGNSDKPLDVFLKLNRVDDLVQLEYLVLSLMGYEFFEMPDILNVKTVGAVHQIKIELRKNLEESTGFSL